MLLYPLGRAQSLREICYGLETFQGKTNHFKLKKTPNRSVLAYANKHRSRQLYKKLFYALSDRCRQVFNGSGKFYNQPNFNYSDNPCFLHERLKSIHNYRKKEISLIQILLPARTIFTGII